MSPSRTARAVPEEITITPLPGVCPAASRTSTPGISVVLSFHGSR